MSSEYPNHSYIEMIESMMGYPIGWTDGIGIGKTSRTRMIGNAIVPDIARVIGLAVAKADDLDRRHDG